MFTNEEPAPITVESEFYICPGCGYKDGFHTSFEREEKGTCKVILICPSCHAKYDPGWNTEL